MLEFKLNGGEGMSKSKTGLQSLSQGIQKRVWDREGRAGSSTQSSENRTKVCGWMGYVVGDLRTSSGHRDVWIRVPVWCYMECNMASAYVLHPLNRLVLDFEACGRGQMNEWKSGGLLDRSLLEVT